MMASVTTTGPDSLRVDAVFYRKNDLAGLIWESEDRWDHPLLRYETSRDFRNCRLAFRWRSGGVVALDGVNGPTLTIEGRDAEGEVATWYVRLWNYAEGVTEDALINLDFDALFAGWEADQPVWAGDVDRMFVSLVAPGYDGTDAALAAPAGGWAELGGIVCDGSGSVLALGDRQLPEHALRIATGYDDLYHLTPARVLRNALRLGYQGLLNHYVGMSHYFRLDEGLVAEGLNGPCAAWHADFLSRAKALGFEVILSLSYEVLARHCPEDWQQRAENGDRALTGWEPPSALLSPANDEAMAWLRGIGRSFAALAAGTGMPVRFQIGEPWWWIMPGGRICLYDDAAVAAFSPVSIGDVRGGLDAGQEATLDAAGTVLAASTAALCEAVRDEAPGAECLLLVYLPTVLDGDEVKRANVPLGWAAPAFDRLQLEDYDWAVRGRLGASARAATAL
ncbi:MAG TPA: TIGR02217 family protein, partial [Allosphingosinicella sp.]|nr:TIGR02217 family protein [Allosphingosinicella sp.]